MKTRQAERSVLFVIQKLKKAYCVCKRDKVRKRARNRRAVSNIKEAIL